MEVFVDVIRNITIIYKINYNKCREKGGKNLCYPDIYGVDNLFFYEYII